MKNLLSFLLPLLLLSLSAVTPSPALAATEKQASRYIEDIGNKVITIIKNKKTDKSQKAKSLQEIFDSSVDFPWVARFVMGRYWREASETQRQRYTELYQRFLVLHYSSLFADYTGGSFKVLYSRPEGDDEFSVGMQIQSSADAGEPVLIDYKIRAEKGKFKVFDVIIEGVSMLTTQRAEFASILNNKGIDYLIEQLQKKSDALAAKKN